MSRRSRFLLAAAALAALFVAGTAGAQSQRYNDPPGRVARISDMRGPISYSPAGDGEWYDAQRNRPLVGGDALWSDRGARAEVQAGSTWIRMDQNTSLSLVQLDDRMLQVEVTEGSVNLRVRRLYPGQRVEVDTPNLAFVIDRPGNFRLDVDREGDNTTIEARQGGGRVYGVGGRFDVRNGDVVVFYGEDVRDYEMYAFPAQDGFDRYLRMRDQRIDRSQSLRYLGDDLVGYSDLDDYGRWSRYPQYGNVWFPSNVYAGWAPYQDGQWVWQDPWGWTWVDDQPWGFAPSHYGRWAWVDGRWGWVPGPRTYRPVYAPALVAFLEVAGGSIGWFPLGPSDVYYPSYDVSSNYFRAVNISNTVVNASTVNNVYNSYGRANAVPLAQGAYRNRAVPTAVTAVPQDVFVNSRPVRQARRENRELSAATPPAGLQLRRTLGVRPGRAAVLGAAPQSNVRPPRAVEDEQVLAHNAAPTAVTPTATSTPAPVAPVRERARRVRQISDQQAATDARASGPRHQGESAAAATPPATPAATTPATATAPGGGRLQALDRDALPRVRGARRMQDRQPPAAPATPAPAAPAAAPAPAPAASAPTTAPAPAPAAQAPAPTPAAQSDAARQAEEARVAQQKAREEQRQAREAQQQAQQQQRESEDALRQAQQQRQQAQAASSDAVQQQQAADADAKAVQERQQARAAAQEAQRQQREAQQAQRDAAQQQAEAAQAAPKPAPAPATPATPAPEAAAAPAQRRDCVPQERIDAMRKRGVAEDRLAALKVCPAEPPVQQ